MMSVRFQMPKALDVQDRYERDEEITNLKETILNMAHRQAELTSKTDGLKDQVHALVKMEKAALTTFNGRLHGSRNPCYRCFLSFSPLLLPLSLPCPTVHL